MFDAGFTELVLLFVIALIILGPERLPKVAAQLGRWIARARRTATELRRQLEREIELNEVTRPSRPPSRPSPPSAVRDAAPTWPPPDQPSGVEPPPASAAEEPPALPGEPPQAPPTPPPSASPADAPNMPERADKVSSA